MKLSVLVPSIRSHNLENLYKSIEKSYSGKFEMVVASPYELPKFFDNLDNVIYIETKRCPIAAQQMALIASSGELISFASDDGWYIEGALDKSFELIKDEPYTTIVTGKYQEGDRVNDNMEVDWYYTLSNHESMKLPYVPIGCKMFNCGVAYRSLLIELGGWASDIFQCCPYSYNDFAIRAYKFGCKFILQEEIMFGCTHEPGTTGTHAPIHRAQTQFDEPMFRGIYGHESALLRNKIDINNWKKSSEKWNERFGG